MPQEMFTFVRDDVLPSWWANAIQKFIGNLAMGFQVYAASPTSVAVAAGPDDEAAVIGIEGKWRWNEATVTRNHPGGAAGEYPVYVVAADNDIRNVPAAGSDFTNYAFQLRVMAPGGGEPPVVAGVSDINRLVAYAIWDGAKITGVRQVVGVPDESLSVGDMKASLQADDHPGWVKLDGRNNLVRADYPAAFVNLMVSLGYTGNGATTFGVPDLRGRTVAAEDAAGVRIATAGRRLLNQSGGAERVTLSALESGLRQHAHGYTDPTHGHGIASVGSHSHLLGGGGGKLPVFDNGGITWVKPGLSGTGAFWIPSTAGYHADLPLQTDAHGADGIAVANGGIGITINNVAAAAAVNSHENMPPYFVGNWFVYTGDALGAEGSSGGGGVAARTVEQLVTANLADAAAETGALMLGKTIQVIQVEVDRAARVQLYPTAATRDADAARDTETDPDDGSGVMLDVDIDAARTLILSPQATISNLDTPVADAIYYRVTNESGAASPVTVTFTYRVVE